MLLFVNHNFSQDNNGSWWLFWALLTSAGSVEQGFMFLIGLQQWPSGSKLSNPIKHLGGWDLPKENKSVLNQTFYLENVFQLRDPGALSLPGSKICCSKPGWKCRKIQQLRLKNGNPSNLWSSLQVLHPYVDLTLKTTLWSGWQQAHGLSSPSTDFRPGSATSRGWGMGKADTCSKIWFSYLWDRDDNSTYFQWVLWGLTDIGY